MISHNKQTNGWAYMNYFNHCMTTIGGNHSKRLLWQMVNGNYRDVFLSLRNNEKSVLQPNTIKTVQYCYISIAFSYVYKTIKKQLSFQLL